MNRDDRNLLSMADKQTSLSCMPGLQHGHTGLTDAKSLKALGPAYHPIGITNVLMTLRALQATASNTTIPQRTSKCCRSANQCGLMLNATASDVACSRWPINLPWVPPWQPPCGLRQETATPGCSIQPYPLHRRPSGSSALGTSSP